MKIIYRIVNTENPSDDWLYELIYDKEYYWRWLDKRAYDLEYPTIYLNSKKRCLSGISLPVKFPFMEDDFGHH